VRRQGHLEHDGRRRHPRPTERDGRVHPEAESPITVDDALKADPGNRFDVVLTNPPLVVKKSSVLMVTAGGTQVDSDGAPRSVGVDDQGRDILTHGSPRDGQAEIACGRS
jgi:hypothetical protein